MPHPIVIAIYAIALQYMHFSFIAISTELVKKKNPGEVGLGGVPTLAFDSTKTTVDAMQEAGLRDQVKVMIGGGQMDGYVKEHCGADAYGTDAVAAVSFSKGWIGSR